MAAYFNLGQMSAQTAVMRVKASKRHPEGVKAFVEQGVVRRELSDNFCFYNGRWIFLFCSYVLLSSFDWFRVFWDLLFP